MNYGDGSAAETWTYDAVGNRSSASATPGAWTYDNLNRMVASPGATYSNDVLGNRTGKVSGGVTTSYSWDAVNRMDVYATTAGSSGYKNQYRADGMRVKKETGWTVSGSPGAYVVNDLGSGLQTRTYYDGQMPVEEDEGPRGGSVAKWTRNIVGARGIEAMVSFDGSVTSTAFPLYDCHGNMVATVARNGGGFSVGNVRTYDVWGGVRSGASTGGPRGRYVANLGHVQDDESGLIYMRARYYEPGSGRFISEDPAMDGINWWIYCGDDPVNFSDSSGCDRIWITLGDYEISFWGGNYVPNNTSENMMDIHWRRKGSKLKDGAGAVRLNGKLKHGEPMPQDLRESLTSDSGRARNRSRKDCGRFGVAVDSLRAYSGQNPIDFLDTFMIAVFGVFGVSEACERFSNSR